LPILLILALFLGSNVAGYFLARENLYSLLDPSPIPKQEPLPFGKSFRVILNEFVAMVPFEVSKYSLKGATPVDLSLHYYGENPDTKMDVSISDSKYFFVENRDIGFPQSLLSRKGLPGYRIFEVFARGPDSDGISLNPYWAIREGLAARLRGDLSDAVKNSTLGKVCIVGDQNKGQVWRVYIRENQETSYVDGTIYHEDKIANISIKFEGETPDVAPIINGFSKAITFSKNDPKQNELLADACTDDLFHDAEPPWETGCRQAHLVGLLISQGRTLDIAKRLYGDYLADKNEEGIKALYSELHFQMHYQDGWENFIETMEKESPYLKEKNPAQ